MKEYVASRPSRLLRQVVTAIVAAGSVAASAAYAKDSNTLIVVQPTDLPGLAQQSGDAMLLHHTVEGRTLLYIEQSQGARLAILDVTDPGHIKGEGSVQLNASGPFDFVSPLGNQSELIHFRQGHEDAILDLRKEKVPNLKAIQGPTSQGSITPLSSDGFAVGSQATATRAPRDYQDLETSNAQDLSSVVDVKQVREEATNAGTGTTFLLTEKGLYVVRRPAAESEMRQLEQEWVLEHTGGG